MRIACQLIIILSFWCLDPMVSWAQSPDRAMPAASQLREPRGIPTFECIGVYWSPAEGAADRTCQVSYRLKGATDWREALPLWFDARNAEYRGSIVNLKSGASYEIRLQLQGSEINRVLEVATWHESFPVARILALPAGVRSTPYVITEGGSAAGYVLYEAGSAGSTIDVAGKHDSCVVVNASYVIVRGVALRGAGRDAMVISSGVHDVVIEGCDISGWGRVAADGWGENMDAAIVARFGDVRRVIVQGCILHHPRSNSNDWTQNRTTGEQLSGHPNGPQAIVFYDNQGNHVIRYNDIYSDESHRFNDALGGGSNFSLAGFPGPDSDIYGNRIENACDDAIEAEGGGCNVRIWHNYMSHVFTGVATASCSVGPAYIYRNVMSVARLHGDDGDDLFNHGVFGKLGDCKGGDGKIYGGGRRYFFHNTLLQPEPLPGQKLSRGAGWAIGDLVGPMTETISRNNIWDVMPQSLFGAVRHPGKELAGWSISDRNKKGLGDYDYDLCTGVIAVTAGQEQHAVKAKPQYAAGQGPSTGSSGQYALDPLSPGYDQGCRISNFNDDYVGNAPDMGACEAGRPALAFGVKAWTSRSGQR